MNQIQFSKRRINAAVLKGLVAIAVSAGLACITPVANAEDPNAGGGVAKKNVGRVSAELGRITPKVNTTVDAARVIVPDGTSLSSSILVTETRWFNFGAEAGKTYTIEALDPYADRDGNGVFLSVFNVDGTTAPNEAQSDCVQEAVAPAMQGFNGLVDGARCVVRTFVPTGTTTLNKRDIYIAVTSTHDGAFQVRVRESTIYGRWTTNGYDFHVELQNTTTDSICAQLVRYPDTGQNTLPTGTVSTSTLTVPPMGAIKTVFANGSAVDGATRGPLRIHGCPGTTNLVAGSLVVNALAFHPTLNTFVLFPTSTVNGGGTSNSW